MKNSFVSGLTVIIIIGSILVLLSCESDRENILIKQDRESKTLVFVEPFNQSQFILLFNEYNLEVDEISII